MSTFYARHIRRGASRPPRTAVLGSTVALALASLLTAAPPAQAAPPTPVSAATARTYLGQLTEIAEGSSSGYSRARFPHWITQSGACNTRETVLKRDGRNVVQNASCAAVSGSWYSEFDGATWYAASDVDIDHIVPLAEAWRSGASGWTTARRQSFANDLGGPQLIAVTDNVNQAKGDKDPAEWLPPRTAYRCVYVRMWVQVKHSYGMTVDPAEKSALHSTLAGC